MVDATFKYKIRQAIISIANRLTKKQKKTTQELIHFLVYNPYKSSEIDISRENRYFPIKKFQISKILIYK